MGDAKRKSRALVNKIQPRSAAEIQADVKQKLRVLVCDIGSPLEFHQQLKTKRNMSITGGNGRIWIQPRVDGYYDVSLSGRSLTDEMSDCMNKLCNTDECGYKQKNSRIGKEEQPFWRVGDFETVEKAVRKYAKTQD